MQLVAYGEQDIFLTQNPQITFFKIVYRRHTNFSVEQIPQNFTNTPNFKKRVSCTISKSGDLIGNIFLVVTLPEIPQLYNIDGSEDTTTKFAWIRKIGFGIIKEIELEIGGQSIDKHYAEWLNVWADLTGSRWEDINKAIGNIPELYNFSSTKQSYKLYIPLSFWFCKASGLALPIMCLQYNDVKINLELADSSTCYNVTPTHYITLQNDLVNFTEYEYISQTIDSYTAYGIFTKYDTITKRLYYTKISSNPFVAINDQNFYEDSYYTDTQRQEMIDKYSIVGYSSHYAACPTINTTTTNITSTAYSYNTLKNVRIGDCFLLIDYIFLDEEERIKFYNAEHSYIIDQLIYTGSVSLDGVVRNINIGLINPCKLIVWMTQLNYLLKQNVNDMFNYTDNYIYDDNDNQIGASIIKNSTISLNGKDRLAMQDEIYFNCVQPMQYFKRAPAKGIHIYSFGLYPDKIQPSGTCNMSKIDNIQIKLQMSKQISIDNPVIFKCYGLVTNIFKIVSGIGGIMFTN